MRIDLFLLFISFLYLYLLTTMKVSQILEMRIVLFISTTRSQRSFWSVICDLVVHKIRHNFPFCKQVSIFGILIMMIMTTTNSISTIILVIWLISSSLFFVIYEHWWWWWKQRQRKRPTICLRQNQCWSFFAEAFIGKFAVDCFFADKSTEKCQDFSWYCVSATSPPSPSWSSWSRWSGPTPPTGWPELSWSSSTCLPPSW